MNKEQVASLLKGFHPNRELRARFGPGHGHPVDGFIGNRSQYLFRQRNPARKQRLKSQSSFQPSRIEEAQQENKSFLGKIKDKAKKLFS